jgi:hypothetical protein
VQFSAATYTAREQPGNSTAQITVTRSGTSGPVSVEWATTNGSATPGVDYTAATGTVAFPKGASTATFAIAINNDDLPEGNETVNLVLRHPTNGAVIGPRSTAQLTIVDDERAVFFASDQLSVAETATSATITVLRSGPPAGGFTVPITIGAGSTAVAGQDYPATLTGATARFISGQTSTTVVIPLLNDTVLDGTRDLVLELGTPVPVAPAVDALGVGTRRSMTLVLGDNDTPGQIGFAAAASTVDEGATVSIVVTRTGVNLARDVTVDYGLALTATPPTADVGTDFLTRAGRTGDFVAAGSGRLTFGAGATSAVIDVKALLDGLKEPAEKFTLELSNPSSGATLIPGRTFHVVTIRDTTQAGVIQWASATATANEEGGAVTLTIRRTGTNLAQDISVSYAVDPVNRGTATPDADYMFAPGTVTFGGGETTKTVTLMPLDDALTEVTETIRITLHSPTGGATLGANKTVVVSLVDGTERFTGRYSGTFTGSFQLGGARSGTEAFNVNNAAIAVSQICRGGECEAVDGSGTVSFNGDATFAFDSVLFGNAACTFTGRFTASGTTAGAAGTWSCDSADLGHGQGTWRATRASLTP